MWIFGYGSLIWKQNFPFSQSRVCVVRGYRRVFYQGSTDHRGVPGSPGRVVTLLPDPTNPTAVVAGVAFELVEESKEQTLVALDFREKGGYIRVEVDAYDNVTGELLPEKCVSYIAMEDNEEYLGPASDEEIAMQIATSAGPSGPNWEYLVNLAEGLKAINAVDEHVFLLEELVKAKLPK